jgi:hypothetical protein
VRSGECFKENGFGGGDEIGLEGGFAARGVLAALETVHRLVEKLAVEFEPDLRDVAGLPGA